MNFKKHKEFSNLSEKLNRDWNFQKPNGNPGAEKYNEQMKNAIESINSRINQTERISEPEDRLLENTVRGEIRKKKEKEWQKFTELQASIRRANIWVTGVQEGLKNVNGYSLFKEITQSIQNLEKDINVPA